MFPKSMHRLQAATQAPRRTPIASGGITMTEAAGPPGDSSTEQRGKRGSEDLQESPPVKVLVPLKVVGAPTQE